MKKGRRYTKVIVFDLWDTIAYHRQKTGSLKNISRECNEDPRKFLKLYEKNLQTFKNITFKKGFKRLFDALGKHFSEQEIEKFAAKRKRYESKYEFYKYAAPLFRKLKKKGYKIALLSNTSQYLGKQIKKSKIADHIDKMFFSYELGTIKPNPANFKAVLNHFDANPSEVLVVGDNYKDDVMGARKAGMRAVHFKDGNQLKRELRKRDIL